MNRDHVISPAVPAALMTIVCVLLLVVRSSEAADWPQYRGPNRDGRSTERGLIREWPEDGPEVVWRSSLGGGYSGISVDGVMLVTQYSAAGKEWAAGFEVANGKQL